MNRRMLTIISVVVLCAVALCMTLTGRKVSAQSASALSDPVYNPYPPGILPANLSSEIARVLAEVDFIESRAIGRWHALTPPTLTGQPPILQNTGTEAVETLDRKSTRLNSSHLVISYAVFCLKKKKGIRTIA